MTSEWKARLDTLKDKYVTAVYIRTADEDYIVARWLYLTSLNRLFYWSAAQAIEKYLKAALLLNGRSAKGYRHKLLDLFDALEPLTGDLLNLDLRIPDQVSFPADFLQYWGTPKVRDYVETVAKHGSPNNRYDFFGIKTDFGDLHKLDQVIFTLRRVAVKLDSQISTNPSETVAEALRKDPTALSLEFKDALVHRKTEAYDLHAAARDNNYSFAPPGYTHTNLSLISHHAVSDLEILFKNNIALAGPMRQWLKANVDMVERCEPDLVRR